MTLPAFAAKRRAAARAAAPLLLGMPAPAAVDRHLLPARRSAANPPHAAQAVERWDREADGRTDARPLHRPCSAYYAAVPITINRRRVEWAGD